MGLQYSLFSSSSSDPSIRPAVQKRHSVVSALVSGTGGKFLSLLMASICLFLLWQIRTDHKWRVQWVEVAGSSLVTPQEIVGASDLANAWSVSLSPSDIERRVEQLPGIVNATVVVDWPAKVTIAVEEEYPILVLRIGGDEYWMFDDYRLVSPFGVLEDLPVLRIEQDAASLPIREVLRRALRGLPQMIAHFPDEKEYVYTLPSGFRMPLSEAGATVYVGDADELDQKMALLSQLEKEWTREEFIPRFINLSSLDNVYYR